MSDVRLGWLIPVRGSFSWEDCTSAELLEHSSGPACSPEPTIGNCISWTEESLLAFWNFLLSLRDTTSLGALGISFHSARNKQSAVLSSANTSRGTTDTSLHSSSKLGACDYIKIYHDASRTLYVRCALDVWQFCRSSNGGHKEKTRPLKGSRLVLVDEMSRGILVL